MTINKAVELLRAGDCNHGSHDPICGKCRADIADTLERIGDSLSLSMRFAAEALSLARNQARFADADL